MSLSLKTIGRNPYIDYLRTLGLFCLVIAHTHAPEWLAIARTFDVPLMVFISATCFNNRGLSYWIYVKKRFQRIYKPVFFFLCIFFIASFAGHFFEPKLNFKWETIVGSFLLFNEPSIGYVWIMRVFLMAALILPFLSKISTDNTKIWNIIFLLLLYVGDKVCFLLSEEIHPDLLHFIFQEYICYLFGYSFIIYSALVSSKAKIKEQYVYIGFIIILFILETLFSHNHFNPAADKYPPRDSYILYGTLMSQLLWLIGSVIKLKKIPTFIEYTSRNSMWLYLWHIIPVYSLGRLGFIDNTWLTRYLYVILCSYILQYVFSYACKKFKFINYFK